METVIEPITPWYSNRKFITPIVGAIATIIVTVLNEVNPAFTIPVEILSIVIGTGWLIVAGIVFGDIGYDWLTLIFGAGHEILDIKEAEAKLTPELDDDQNVETFRHLLDMIEHLTRQVEELRQGQNPVPAE